MSSKSKNRHVARKLGAPRDNVFYCSLAHYGSDFEFYRLSAVLITSMALQLPQEEQCNAGHTSKNVKFKVLRAFF